MLLHRNGELAGAILPTREFPYDLMYHATFNPDKEQLKHPEFCFTVYMDTVATPSSIFTSTKTTSRDHYNRARERAGIESRQEPKEVILYNENDQVTECSVSNVSFWVGGAWVTPPLETGCLPGTTRRWMIEHGYVKEGIVMKDDVHDGDYVLLSNGNNGIQVGRITIADPS
jgi:branched-subunit amino acid aminotransferase/4-amino-4-deoxychorismate lyase